MNKKMTYAVVLLVSLAGNLQTRRQPLGFQKGKESHESLVRLAQRAQILEKKLNRFSSRLGSRPHHVSGQVSRRRHMEAIKARRAAHTLKVLEHRIKNHSKNPQEKEMSLLAQDCHHCKKRLKGLEVKLKDKIKNRSKRQDLSHLLHMIEADKAHLEVVQFKLDSLKENIAKAHSGQLLTKPSLALDTTTTSSAAPVLSQTEQNASLPAQQVSHDVTSTPTSAL